MSRTRLLFAVMGSAVICGAVLLSASIVSAGTLYEPTTFTSDADCGISSSKTYIHAIDPGNQTSGTTINGVAFDYINVRTDQNTADYSSTLGYRYEIAGNPTGVGFSAGNGSTCGVASGQGVYNLLYDFMYGGAGTTGYVDYSLITLTNPSSGPQMAVGKDYEVRVYYRPWTAGGTRVVDVTFDEDGTGELGASIEINEDGANPADARYVGYRYTYTGSPVTIMLDQQSTTDGWHFYGVTNELVPEPSSVALLLAGVFGLLAYAWRKR